MFFETPIVAYASTAIPGTLGGSGVLVETKEPEAVAGKMHQVITDQAYREEIIEKQKRRLEDFSYDRIKEQILKEIKMCIRDSEYCVCRKDRAEQEV